jgi:hypothetical protein
MKRGIIKPFPGIIVLVVVLTLLSFTSAGQPVIGVLPVNTSAVNNDVLNNQQLQSLGMQMQVHLVTLLKTSGTISRLTREHILLLMKEVPSPDPDYLTEDAYKIISKNGRLNYLLRCSIESIGKTDKILRMQVNVIVVEGNSGKILLDENAVGETSVATSVTEQILLNKVFKPSVTGIVKQIKDLEL